MPALNFQARFADDVESGVKPQSIRAWRKRPFKLNDRVYLYTGMRTKACRKLGESDCIAVEPVTIRRVEGSCVAIIVGKQLLTRGQAEQVARDDGFDTLDEFAAFFVSGDEGTFSGQLIRWDVPITKTGGN